MALFLSISLCLFGQNNPYNEVSIASPTTAALGKYIDYPVNYHTGVPDISIPLYTIESGGLQVPIALNYHASGLRVLEPASWVGVGWSLTAGGYITRTVRGAPDERNTSTVFDQSKGHFTDKGYSAYYYYNNNQDWQAFASGRSDGEPDKFFFSAGPYSGKFYFGDDQRPVLESKQDIDIQPTFLGTGSIASFTITTPDGTKYLFGKTSGQNNCDITNPFTIGSGYIEGTTISTWYLHTIRSADSSTQINFTYTQEQYSYHTIATPPIASTDVTNTETGRLVKNYFNGVRLSQIAYDNGTVTFIPGNVRTDLGAFTPKDMADSINKDAKALGAIEIRNNMGACKKYILSTSYFTDPTTPLPSMLGATSIYSDTRRLRLDSIQEMSCQASGNLSKPPFKFNYYLEKVPRRLTFAQDHWGFYNGQTGNSTMLPTYTEITPSATNTIYGANRETAWPAMRGGTLNRIIYPTGGYTQFDFEPNRVPITGGTPTYNDIMQNSIGYDGSNPYLKTQTVTLAGGIYKGGIINSNGGSNASFYIYNASTGEYPLYASASPGNSNSDQRYIAAGTYTVAILKDCSNTGSMVGVGANGYLQLYTGTTGPPDTIVGGLRIKRIMQHDHLRNTDEETNYTYTASGNCSGILFGRSTYVQLVRNDQIAQYGNWTPAGGYTPSCSPAGCISCTNFIYLKSGGSIQPLTTTNGYHVGYKEVMISRPGHGYSIYRYNVDLPYGYAVSSVSVKEVDRTSCGYATPNYPARPEELSYSRGSIKDELHFAQNGKLLKELNYYDSYGPPTDSTPAFLATSLEGTFLGTFYNLFAIKKTSTKIITTDYAQDTSSAYVSNVTVTDFTSPYHSQPVKMVYVNSNGDSLITRLKYAFDYRSVSCDAAYTCPQLYRSACVSCLAQYQTEQTQCSGQGSQCYTNAYLKYQKCMTTARVDFSNCRSGFWATSGGYAVCQSSARTSADAQLKPVLTMQLTDRNPVIETTKWNNNRLLSAQFNYYTLDAGSIYKCYPSRIDEIELAYTTNSFTMSTVSGNTITEDSKYLPQSAAIYKGGRLVQVQETDNRPTAYVYDYNGEVPVAIVKGALESQVAYTSFEADGKGNWVVPSAASIDVTAITGGKIYTFTGSNNISKTGLNAAQAYIISYWSKNPSAYVISGTLGSATKGVSVGSWSYYEHRVSGISSISIGATSGVIDELRLYPESAQMSTYTYEPHIGISSSCDNNSQILYYKYDSLGRLKSLQDRDGNIKSYYDYQYQSSFVQ